MYAENDWQSLKQQKGSWKQKDDYLHQLTTTNNEIPETVEAVNIPFMSWEIIEQ